MQGQFEEFLVVRSCFPSIVSHLLSEVVECVWNESVRVVVGECASLFLCQGDEFWVDSTWHLSALAEDHSPHRVVHHHESTLALFDGEKVHECDVLHILRERCDERRITHSWPDVCHLVEEFYEHVVDAQFVYALSLTQFVDDGVNTAEVAHH